MTARINGSEAGRRKRKDREKGVAAINQTFRNPTKFHKESFLLILEKKRGSLDVCREKLQGGRMTPPPPHSQSVSQLTEEGRLVETRLASLEVSLGSRQLCLIQISLRHAIRQKQDYGI
jgi:hypothetical protein